MVMLLFKRPACFLHVMCGVASNDDVLALANELPVCLDAARRVS
jgi:hypothetical protein